MAKPSYPGPTEALELYEALVERHPEVARKGAKNPYTSRNGHMFSFLGPDGQLALRLPPDAFGEFRQLHGEHDVISYGAVMKEYVAVPSEVLADTDTLFEWFVKGYDYIATLKPKPTNKPKKK